MASLDPQIFHRNLIVLLQRVTLNFCNEKTMNMTPLLSRTPTQQSFESFESLGLLGQILKNFTR